MDFQEFIHNPNSQPTITESEAVIFQLPVHNFLPVHKI